MDGTEILGDNVKRVSNSLYNTALTIYMKSLQGASLQGEKRI
jgi:hypothetical protein